MNVYVKGKPEKCVPSILVSVGRQRRVAVRFAAMHGEDGCHWEQLADCP